MPVIRSLEDLKKMRAEAIEKKKLKTASGQAHVVVCMGTCGIAAGARDTMKAILETIENEKAIGITITQTGCIGLCEREPIVQVTVGDQAKIMYGKVTPSLAKRIVKEHVIGGMIIKENVIPA